MNSFGLQRAYQTAQGCEVLQIKTIATRVNVLTPVEHIILWVPEKEPEKELDKR